MSAEKSEVLMTERKDDIKIKVKDVNGVLLQQVYSFKYLGSELMTERSECSSETKSTDSLEQMERNNQSDM